MRILYLKWDSYGGKYVEKALHDNGHELIIFDFPRSTEDTRKSEALASKLANEIILKKAEAVFSLNYYPVAAIAASACRIKYISWTYDSPYIQLYSKTIDYPTNYAFVFDKGEYLNMRKKGIERVFYLPMAAPVEYFDEIKLSDEMHKKYDADIAMVGSMYTEKKHNLERHFDGLDKYTLGYLEGLIAAQSNLYGASILESGLNEEIIKNIQKVCPIYANGDGYEDAGWTIANYFLARMLTKRERTDFIDALSDKYTVALYTHEPTLNLKADNRGSIDYYKEFPLATKCAKINLNITLRSIISGIPLRAIDIMGCGGFLLTNYQADFEDFFIAGEDYVFYESKDDMIDKAGYYLEHADEREKIAASGYEKVKKYHSYDNRIKQMFSIINNDEILS